MRPNRFQRVESVRGEIEKRAVILRVLSARVVDHRIHAGALQRHRSDWPGDAAADDQCEGTPSHRTLHMVPSSPVMRTVRQSTLDNASLTSRERSTKWK